MKFASQSFERTKVQNLIKSGGGVYYGRCKKGGKIHKQALGTDFTIAKRKLKEFLDEVENKGRLSPDLLFQHLTDEWLASLRLRNLKALSLLRRETCVRGLLPHFKGRMVREVDQPSLEAWARKRIKEVTARTFNIDRETLIGIFNFAVAKKILGKNPVTVVRVGEEIESGVDKRKVKKTKIVPPTREEFSKLVALLEGNVKTKEAAPFIQFLAATGLRLGEAVHVTWADVDFERRKIRVTGGAEGTKNRRERSIPLFPKARVVLEAMKPATVKPVDKVFGISNAKKALSGASKKLGKAENEYFGHHDLRHFFASNAVEKGIDFKTLADWLGHSDGGILAASTYSHLRQSHSDELAELMA